MKNPVVTTEELFRLLGAAFGTRRIEMTDRQAMWLRECAEREKIAYTTGSALYINLPNKSTYIVTPLAGDAHGYGKRKYKVMAKRYVAELYYKLKTEAGLRWASAFAVDQLIKDKVKFEIINP